MTHVSRAIKYLRKYFWPAVGGLVSLLLVNLANLAAPQLLRLLIDKGIKELAMEVVWQAAGGLLLVALVRGGFNFLQRYLAEVSSQGVAYDIRNVIFEKLQNLSFSYHDQAQTGKLMTRMTSDVEIVRNFVGNGFLQLISAAMMLIGTAVILFSMNWKLALVVLAMIPFIGIVFGRLVRKVMPVSREVQKNLGKLNTILQENLAGVRVVRAFAGEQYELDRYLQQNDKLLDINLGFLKLFTSHFPVVFFIGNLGLLGVVWVGGLEVINAHMSLGELVAFISYIGFMLMPIFMIGMISASLSQAEASAERVFEVIDARSDVLEKPDAVVLEKVKGKVSFEDVSFRYAGGEDKILKGISFTAEPGETVAILGQTGAGKSTIINLIPRFYDVTEGAVKIDGVDLRDIKLDSLRSQIGIVLQETTLFSGTIQANISYGAPKASLEDVRKAAQAAQAADFIEELPAGYETEVGERGVGLSGGQKQRIAIARALLIDPQVLILDDSTSAVDAETEYLIQNALDGLMKNRTSFVIAQRISTVRNADKIILLDNGKLADIGTHEELMERSEMYYEILETQFGERAMLLVGQSQEVSS